MTKQELKLREIKSSARNIRCYMDEALEFPETYELMLKQTNDSLEHIRSVLKELKNEH